MEKVKVGVIGVGIFGENHARVFSESDDCVLVAVADLNEDRAKEVATKYGAKRWYKDYHELLNDDIDAVSIVVPDFAHKEPCIAAAEAGKHILVEKPLATTIEDADAIMQASKKANVKFMVDFANRWSPPFVQAKEAITSGKLGDVLYIDIHLNDTIWVPTEMLSWANKSSVLWFLGSHSLDLCRWLLNSEVRNAEALTSDRILKKAMGIDTNDYYLSTIEFANGTIVTMENSWILPQGLPTVFEFYAKIVGTKGMIKIDTSHNGCVQVYDQCNAAYPDVLCLTESGGKLTGFNVNSIRHFIDCIRHDQEPSASVEDGLAVTKVLADIEKSARLCY
jgi:predicted dehydrogenase